jgi:hypothetical protein
LLLLTQMLKRLLRKLAATVWLDHPAGTTVLLLE